MNLRKKYKQFKNEIEDIERDYEHRCLEYAEEIRRQQRELDCYMGLVKNLLKDSEITMLREKSEFDPNQNKLLVPDFYLRGKDIVFPKIKNARDLINHELKHRDVVLYAGGEVLNQTKSNFANGAGAGGKPPKRNIAAKIHSSLT